VCYSSVATTLQFCCYNTTVLLSQHYSYAPPSICPKTLHPTTALAIAPIKISIHKIQTAHSILPSCAFVQQRRNVTISFVTSVCLSVCLSPWKNFGSHWKDFSVNLTQCAGQIQIQSKSHRNSSHLATYFSVPAIIGLTDRDRLFSVRSVLVV